MRRVDYERMASLYERGRTLPPSAFAAWHAAVAPFIPPSPSSRILDIGSGTGMWCTALADWSGARVIGIEPARGMRHEAQRSHRHPRVEYVGGGAEFLPLSDGTVDLAWLSTVIHHVGDLAACAREARRVVRPGAPVLIRSAFPDALTDFASTARFFPGALRIIAQFPTVQQTERVFQAAGFGLESTQSVAQESAPSVARFLDRVKTRADTTLALLPDDEFASGLARLEAAAARERFPEPVVHSLGLLVFR